MHYNLRPPDVVPVVFRFNYEAVPSLQLVNVYMVPDLTFLLLIPYVTL